MPSSTHTADPYLQIEHCGSLRGQAIYKITKHVPQEGTAKTIRCMDLGKEALGNYKAEEGGCSNSQFLNDTNDLRCERCGMDFSKSYLRKDLYLEVKGIPD